MAAGAGTAATPVDLGLGAPKRGGIPEPVGYTEGKLILDITACSTQTTLNSFEIRLQASHDATFTTFVTLFSIPLGTVATHHSGSVFISQPLSNLAAGFPAPAQVPVRIAQPFCKADIADFGRSEWHDDRSSRSETLEQSRLDGLAMGMSPESRQLWC